MFLTRMVSGFICSKNSNKNANNPNQQQQQSQQSQPTKSPKPNKKAEKCKRSLSKTDSKKSISELLKSPTKEPTAQPPPQANGSSSSNSNNNNNNGNSKETPSTSKATLKPPTKVKSGSWKRSEKQISSYNSISVTGKKSKSLRKRSPTWLKFPNSPVKIAEKVTYVSPADSTSVCRPGTLYSDVLFGAGSSCLVKIKTLTPRRSSNTAQKKLTKALLKCTGNENEASGSETETDRELFPSLNADPATNKASAATTDSGKSSHNATPIKSDDEADVVILSETNGVRGAENGFGDDVSYGNYLEQHFKQMNGTSALAQKPTAKPFTVDIPQWNFLDADISTDAYPKFLCQFEDEHYLKAEKMALLGLKLALGNGNSNPQQGKFKF